MLKVDNSEIWQQVELRNDACIEPWYQLCTELKFFGLKPSMTYYLDPSIWFADEIWRKFTEHILFQPHILSAWQVEVQQKQPNNIFMVFFRLFVFKSYT